MLNLHIVQSIKERYPQGLWTGYPRSYLARLLLFVLVYAVFFALSLYLVPKSGSTSIIFPAAAAGIAILYFWGVDLWPALVIAIFGVLLLRGGVNPALAASTALADALESVVAVYLLNFLDFHPMFSRLRDTMALLSAAAAGSFVSASVIALGLYLFGSIPGMLNTPVWVGIFVGHFVSLISFGPFALRWLYRPLFRKTPREVIEGTLIFGLLITLSILLYWTPYGTVLGISLLYISIIPLLWAALRTGPRGMSFGLFAMALIAATGILYGYGPVSHASNLSQTLFGIQLVTGTLSVIFLLFTSLTEERKEAVVNLESHVAKLEVALEKISTEDQAKSDFIAILAHELRNPLSPLLSGLELLKRKADDRESDVLHMMGAHLHSVARLLDDLLDISRISQKKFKLQKEPVEIHGVVASTLEMVKPHLEERRHSLTVTMPEEEVWLSGDRVRLSQIFVNLLTNAAKYTDEGGAIALDARREGGELVVRVKDSGIGIEPGRLSKIFEPFGGAEGTLHTRGGLRIGLSLAKRMVEMHHGTIAAHSLGPGKGSEFVVRLPLPAEAPLPLESAAPRGRGRFSKKSVEETARRVGGICVLVVDDNRAAADTLAQLLRLNGHQTLLAYDAPQALAKLEEQTPHAALLDIGLPGMDGYELARRIRERLGKKVALIALTGYGQAEDKQKARDAGFDEHLIKPVSIADIERIFLELMLKA